MDTSLHHSDRLQMMIIERSIIRGHTFSGISESLVESRTYSNLSQVEEAYGVEDMVLKFTCNILESLLAHTTLGDLQNLLLKEKQKKKIVCIHYIWKLAAAVLFSC